MFLPYIYQCYPILGIAIVFYYSNYNIGIEIIYPSLFRFYPARGDPTFDRANASRTCRCYTVERHPDQLGSTSFTALICRFPEDHVRPPVAGESPTWRTETVVTIHHHDGSIERDALSDDPARKDLTDSPLVASGISSQEQLGALFEELS